MKVPKPQIMVLLLGIVAIILLALYSYSSLDISGGGSELRKADFAALYNTDAILGEGNDSAVTADSLKEQPKVFRPDTARNILFFGDSMLEGLCRRFIDYADQNGHQLNTVVWYSSSSDLWANTDTLEYFMKKHKPNYIVVCLCSNELFVKDIDKRKENIKKIVKKIGNIPYVWISPPNWKDDTGINDAIISVVGKGRYFDSRSLQLERGKDHAHPTFPAAAIWMDTIARWLKSPACENPIVMEWPEKEVPSRNVTMLQPYYN